MTAKFRPRTARAHGDSKAGRGKIRASNRWFPENKAQHNKIQKASSARRAAKPKFQSAFEKKRQRANFRRRISRTGKGELPRCKGRTPTVDCVKEPSPNSSRPKARTESSFPAQMLPNREIRLRTARALTALKPSKTFTILRFRPKFPPAAAPRAWPRPPLQTQAKEPQKRRLQKPPPLLKISKVPEPWLPYAPQSGQTPRNIRSWPRIWKPCLSLIELSRSAR